KQALLDLLEVTDREEGEAAGEGSADGGGAVAPRGEQGSVPLDNLALKAASMALAALLWYVIAGAKTSEMGLTVPVELQNFPADLELTGELAHSVEVQLRATPGIIQHIGAGDVSAHIDLAGVGEGEHVVHLGSGSIRVPFGVTVVRVNPSTIVLNIERTLQKTVPVRPRLTGRPAQGFEVAEVGSQPA